MDTSRHAVDCAKDRGVGAGLSSRVSGFDGRAVSVGYLLGKVALEFLIFF